MQKSATAIQSTAYQAYRRVSPRLLAAGFLLMVGSLLGGCDLTGSIGTPVGQNATATPPEVRASTSVQAPLATAAEPTQSSDGTSLVTATPSAEQIESQAPTEADAQQAALPTPFVLLSAGAVADKWTDASYGGAVLDLHNTEVERDGHPVAKVTYNCGNCAFGASDYEGSNAVELTKYTHMRFWVNGGPTGGQIFGVSLGNGADTPALPIEKYLPGGSIPANTWQEVVIPVSDLMADYAAVHVNLVRFFAPTDKPQPPFYIDDIRFVNEEPPPGTPTLTQAQVSVDISSKRHPISPLIYGMSNAPYDVMSDANLTLNRLGGDLSSRYNWTLGDASNAGADDVYENVSLSQDPAAEKPSGVADIAMAHDKNADIATLLTIPMLGYVARDNNNDTKSTNVPDDPQYDAKGAIQGYDPEQNRRATSVRSVARKNAPFQDPPDPNAPSVYQDEWVSHLTNTFGKSANGGVDFYAMDNEPDLWADTHRDIHPSRLGYDDLLDLFLEYSGAVKAVDNTARVTGPVSWGWTNYWYSALDAGNDNYQTAADRKAHGGMPFIPWFLDQVNKSDQKTGERTLDVLDIHHYPQAPGVQSGMTNSTDAALRLRSTRGLWDPSYKDESWIADGDSYNDPTNVELIPRMKGWIDQYYPGTKLGITEWRWYAEATMNGALAIADVLGIYGREGVDLACYWDDIYNAPLKLGMPGEEAFKMYRNFDGHDGTFGDVSVAATSATDPDKLSVYASEDTKSNQVKIMVLNKTGGDQMNTQIAMQGGNFRGPAKVYQMSDNTDLESSLSIEALPDVSLDGASVNVSLPPYSITLLVIDKAQ